MQRMQIRSLAMNLSNYSSEYHLRYQEVVNCECGTKCVIVVVGF